jgi:hypothetical protein
MFIGSVGLGYFFYGKRQRRGLHLTAGILLMVYPYFVPNILLMVLIAGGVVGLVYFLGGWC